MTPIGRPSLPRSLFKFSRVHALLSILISVGSLTLVMLIAVSHGERFSWRTTGFSIHGSPSPDVLDDLVTIPTFELNDPNEPFNYRWYTQAKLRWLTACLIRGNCPPNADKVRTPALFFSLTRRSSLSIHSTVSGLWMTAIVGAKACGALAW